MARMGDTFFTHRTKYTYPVTEETKQKIKRRKRIDRIPDDKKLKDELKEIWD